MLGNTITWNNILYACVLTNKTEKGDLNRWECGCSGGCGGKAFFSAYFWQFPFAPAGKIRQSGIIKTICDVCWKAGKRNAKPNAERYFGVFISPCLRTMRILKYPKAFEMLEYIATQPEEWFCMDVTKEADIPKAIELHGELKNDLRLMRRNILHKVLTYGAKEGLWAVKGNRWHSVGEEVPDNIAELKDIQHGADTLRYVLMLYPASCARVIAIEITKMKEAGALDPASQRVFSLDAPRASVVRSVNRVAGSMWKHGLLLRDGVGKAAKFRLSG